MRHLVFAVASFVALAGLAVSTPSAQADQKGKKPGQGQGQKGKMGQKGQQAQRGQRPNTGAIAAKMIEKFDRNGDRALNAKELTAALTAMREQRGNRGGPGQGAGKGGAGRGGKGAAGRGGKGGAGKGQGRGKSRRPGSGK